MNKDTLLIVQNLTLNRSGADILKNINLELRRGEIHVLMGLNGSGKTSVALTLMGSAGYQPDSGRISFEGQDITHASMTERAQMGMTIAWQEPARFEGLPVADYLALGMKVPSRERIEEALGLVSLSPAAYLGRPESGNALSWPPSTPCNLNWLFWTNRTRALTHCVWRR
jgi:Fe-S cluster assembly ATP-binding protein